jgi:taurine dioxygenase
VQTTVDQVAVGDDWSLIPLAGLVGVEVRHADLRVPFSPTELDSLHRLLAESGVAIFSNQTLSDLDHLNLAKQLGTPKPPASYLPSLREEGFPDICVISTDNGRAYMTDQWHSDVTWMENPSRYSILHMRIAPAAGGGTMWASQIHAYERLSQPLKDLLTGLTAVHEIPAQEGMSTVHPVVCVHPVTAKRALFVNPIFTRRICELNRPESDALLSFLFAHSTQPEIVCRWRWSTGDVAIWDNHFVQHYAINDYGSSPRKVHRIEIVGSAPRGAVGDIGIG